MIDLDLKATRRDLRQFALLQLAFFALVSFLMWHRGFVSATVAGVIVGGSAAVAVFGWLWLPLLRVVYTAWVFAAFPLGWVLSYAIAAIIFYLVITPIGLIMKLCGYDPLQREFDNSAETYWEPRSTPTNAERYFRQY